MTYKCKCGCLFDTEAGAERHIDRMRKKHDTGFHAYSKVPERVYTGDVTETTLDDFGGDV